MKLFSPFILILISVALYFLYISPSIAEVESLSAKKAEYANVLAQSKELKNKRDSVLAAYNGISEEDLARLNKIIPSSFDGVVFANEVNTLASRYGLSVKSFQVNQPTADARAQIVTEQKKGSYQSVAVTLTVNGDYNQFIVFLKEMETSLRLIDVGSLGIKGDSRSGNLEYTVQLYTYSLPASPVSSSAVATSTGIVGQDILTLVEKLRRISIDPSLFSSSLWESLKDSGTPLVPEAQGRVNPFAPIGAESFTPVKKQ